MCKKKSLKINAIFNMVKTALNILFPFITFPYASRVLGVDNLGKVSYCTSVVGYFILFSTLGISTYAVREGSKLKNDKARISKFAKEMIAIITFSFSVSYVIFLLYTILICREDLRPLMFITSISISFTTYSIEWIYQIYEDYGYITIRAFCVQLFALLIMFLIVKTSDDYIKYAVVQILGSSGGSIFNIFASRRYINWHQKTTLEIKRHLPSIFTMFGISLASSIYLNIDSVMLGSMRKTYDVGLYSSASKVAQIVKVSVTSISSVLIPRMSYYVGIGKIKEHKELLYKSFDRIMLMTIPLCLTILLLSKDIIFIISGRGFEDANIAAKILSFNVIFAVSDGILSYQVLLPYKRERKASLCTIIGAFVNLFLNIFIIPLHGMTGAALTTIISEFIVFCGLCYFSRDIMDRKIMRAVYTKYLLLSILPGIAVFLINEIKLYCITRVLMAIICAFFLYMLELKIAKNSFIDELFGFVKNVLVCFSKVDK